MVVMNKQGQAKGSCISLMLSTGKWVYWQYFQHFTAFDGEAKVFSPGAILCDHS